jgi:hypothetical protein
VAAENDWHLHSPYEIPGAPYDTRPGSGAPDGGKAHSGVRSLHLGRHLDPTTTTQDTIRLRQVSAFVLDSQGDPNIPGVVIGSTSTLEFWQIMSMLDDENFGSGYLSGITFGGGQVQISLLGSNAKFEKWQVLTPNFNGYDSTTQETASLCGFDPGDDQMAPGNETMCNASPMFADKGDFFGTDATCVTDTDHNDTRHKDCGDRTCTPGPGCTEPSSTPNKGVWSRTAFSLSPFAGRVARLRFITMVEGGWSFGTYRSALEPDPAQPAYQYYDGDDGWMIDDIKLTDLRQFASIIGPDNLTGLSQCNTGQASSNCGVITMNITGSAAFGTRRLIGVDALLQPVKLDARASTAGDDPATAGVAEGACDNGVLEYEWKQLDINTLAVVDTISPFSPQGDVKVAPSRDSLYRVQARCSSDLTCVGSQDVVVKVYTGDGNDLGPQTALNAAGVATEVGLDVVGGATATLQWPARPQPPGISGYDVFRYTSGPVTAVDVFSGGTFDGICLVGSVANAPLATLVSTTDAAMPAAGTTFMYQVAHSSTNVQAIAPLGVQPASANGYCGPAGTCVSGSNNGAACVPSNALSATCGRAGVLVTAGVTCP